MKLPISFGSRLFFRIIFPGAVVAFSVSRFFPVIISASNLEISTNILFSLATLLFGTMFLVLDMPIYMFFEGRRFWPNTLFAWGCRRERARLLKLHCAMRKADLVLSQPHSSRLAREAAERRYLEAADDISSFKLDRRISMPRVYSPTQLGNLISSYEQYPRLKYGLDAVFFWPRLWVSIEKEVREEIDNQQSLADGLLYLTAALMIASLIFLLYVAIALFFPTLAHFKSAIIPDLILSISCAVGSRLIYRASLYTHAQFGEYFKAVFDQYRQLLKFDEMVDLIASATNDQGLARRHFIDKNVAVWRLLRWHRVRLPGRNVNQRIRLP